MNQACFETRQLLAFRTLAETGSFTETARRLHLTQSAISHSIRSLESQVQSPLFNRIGKKAQLTEIGERLLEHTHVIFSEMDAAFRAIDEVRTWGKGRIRVGATTSACQYILPSVLREFRECFPQCKVAVQPEDTPILLEKLRRSEIDLAICLKPWKAIDYEITELFADTMYAIVSPSHPLGKSTVLPKEANEHSFVVYNRTSYTFELINRYLQSRGIQMDHFMELGSMEAIKELAKMGLGIGILADWMVEKEYRDGSLKLLKIGSEALKRDWVICRQKGHHPTIMESTFENLTCSVCSNLESAISSLHNVSR